MCWVNRRALACLCADGNVRFRELDTQPSSRAKSRERMMYTNFSQLTCGIIAFDGVRDYLAVAGAGGLRVWSLGRSHRTCYSGLYLNSAHSNISPATLLMGLSADKDVSHVLFVDDGARILVCYSTGTMCVLPHNFESPSGFRH